MSYQLWKLVWSSTPVNINKWNRSCCCHLVTAATSMLSVVDLVCYSCLAFTMQTCRIPEFEEQKKSCKNIPCTVHTIEALHITLPDQNFHSFKTYTYGSKLIN